MRPPLLCACVSLATLLGCAPASVGSAPDSAVDVVDASGDAPLDDAATRDDAAVDAATRDIAAVDAATRDAGSDAASDPLGVSRDLRVIVEPSEHGAALVAAIRGARRSVHMTMYLLSARSIIDALVDAQRRGLEVRVVLNRTLPGGTAANGSSYDTLTQAGVAVRWAPSRFDFTHEKCVIVDGAEAWVMTMNATQAGIDTNREFLVVDREPDDVRDAEAVFAGDFAGAPIDRYAGRMVLAPLNAQARVVALVQTATRTLDIEAEELEDRTTARAIQARIAAGVAVRVVLSDGTPTASATRTLADLVAAGARIVTLHSPYVHAKAIVADGARAYAGSANLTYTSLTQNRELGVFFDTPDAVRAVADTLAADFAAGTAYTAP